MIGIVRVAEEDIMRWCCTTACTYLVAHSLVLLNDLLSTVQDNVQVSCFGSFELVAIDVLHEDRQLLLGSRLVARLDQMLVLGGDLRIATIHVAKVGYEYVLAVRK